MICATKAFNILLFFILADSVYSQSSYNNNSASYNNITSYSHSLKNKIQKLKNCPFNICEDEHISGYPTAKVRALIKKDRTVQSYFGDIIKPVTISIDSRIIGDEFQPLCETIDRIILPKFMPDVNKIHRVIANLNDFKQFVKVQNCRGKGGECLKGCLINYRSRCVQKFQVVKLLTVGAQQDKLEYNLFEVPSTCVCTYAKQI